MTCDQVQKLLRQDPASCSLGERLNVVQHIDRCLECRAYHDGLCALCDANGIVSSPEDVAAVERLFEEDVAAITKLMKGQ
jgi:hypothetical protein